MRRITVSLDEALVDIVEADVAAGRAASVSAWVASAIRAKAQARAELIEELRQMEQEDPTPPEVVGSLARALDLSDSVVASALGRPRGRRAG